ncbi:VOC family protein [Natranaeroarchaeum aerophilus]|uniref:VOC family protein n=1 Tax=Natranaeroarchaeum aerophilus TaxID=2917711 RepID=A0AAE3K7R9_9EURY|nr:VOC family protein [Natranaeroarchaeum aerophilus]MCL9814214.1 VOC family protein [Natranaeroarchaeum aerophilus]
MTGTLPADTTIGRVRLRVNDLERVVEFYETVVGLESLDRSSDYATLGAGGDVLLELDGDPDAAERPSEAAGLFHIAVRVPDEAALADALVRIEREWVLDGASDHLVSQALYLSDPGGNGVEIYCDRPKSEWSRDSAGRVAMDTLPLERGALPDGDPDRSVPEETDIGHVHLETTDLDRARSFYVDDVGFEISAAFPGNATFLAAGDYHHHVGINGWNGRQEPVGDHCGLEYFEVVVPESVVERLADDLSGARWVDDALAIEDPDGIEVRFRDAK